MKVQRSKQGLIFCDWWETSSKTGTMYLGRNSNLNAAIRSAPRQNWPLFCRRMCGAEQFGLDRLQEVMRWHHKDALALISCG